MIRKTHGILTSIKQIKWGRPNSGFTQAYLQADSVELVQQALRVSHPMPGTRITITRNAGGQGLANHSRKPADEQGIDEYQIFLYPGTPPSAENHERRTKEEKYLFLREYLRIRMARDGCTFKTVNTDQAIKKYMHELRGLASLYMAENEITRQFGRKLENEVAATLNFAFSHFVRHLGAGPDWPPASTFMSILALRAIASQHRPAGLNSFPEIFFADYYRLQEMAGVNKALKALDPRDPFTYETTLVDVCCLLTGSTLEFHQISARVKDERLVTRFLAGDNWSLRRREFGEAAKRFSRDHGLAKPAAE